MKFSLFLKTFMKRFVVIVGLMVGTLGNAYAGSWISVRQFQLDYSAVVGACKASLEAAIADVTKAATANDIHTALNTHLIGSAKIPTDPTATPVININNRDISSHIRSQMVQSLQEVVDMLAHLSEAILDKTVHSLKEPKGALSFDNLQGANVHTDLTAIIAAMDDFFKIFVVDLADLPSEIEYNAVSDEKLKKLSTDIKAKTVTAELLRSVAPVVGAALGKAHASGQIVGADEVRAMIQSELGVLRSAGSLSTATGSGLDYKHVGAVDSTRAQENTEAVATFAHELRGARTPPKDFVTAVGKVATLETDVAGLKAGKADKTDLAAGAGRVKTLETTVGNAGAGLVKEVADVKAVVGATAGDGLRKQVVDVAGVVGATVGDGLRKEVADVKASLVNAATKAEVEAAVGKDDSAGLRKRVKDIEDGVGDAPAQRRMQQLLGDDTVAGSIAHQLKAIRDLL